VLPRAHWAAHDHAGPACAPDAALAKARLGRHSRTPSSLSCVNPSCVGSSAPGFAVAGRSRAASVSQSCAGSYSRHTVHTHWQLGIQGNV
jgi:hypothetical protein